MTALSRDARPIVRKSAGQVAIMREAGRRLREVFDLLKEQIGPGVLDTDLDRLAREGIEQRESKPAFLGYRGYPATICCSINDEIVHGIPRGRRLAEGDIVGVDCGLRYRDFFADSAWTFAIGKVSETAQRLLDVTEESLWRGIDQMREGNRVKDVSWAIQECAQSNGFHVVRDYTGHGIGRSMHEAPEAPNFVSSGGSQRLREGVVIALEPMVNERSAGTRVLEDGWTVVTVDGGLSAHFEHTVAVTDGGPEVLTS